MTRFALPNPNETAPRYTTVELVKERLAIEPTDVSRDTEVELAIVAGEYMIDVFCGRAVPDLAGDPDDPPVVTVVPAVFQEAALSMAIAVWKEADAPTGTAGSEAFFGAISIAESSRQLLERSPGLVSFRVANVFDDDGFLTHGSYGVG